MNKKSQSQFEEMPRLITGERKHVTMLVIKTAHCCKESELVDNFNKHDASRNTTERGSGLVNIQNRRDNIKHRGSNNA